MIERLERREAQLDSALGRTSPVVKLAIAIVWLVGLAFTLRLLPPARHRRRRARRLCAGRDPVGAPCAGARAAVARGPRHRPVQHAVLGREHRPDRPSSFTLGPFRITGRRSRPASASPRVIAIAAVGAVFASRPTRRGSSTRSSSRPASPSASRTARWPRTRRSRGSPRTSPRCARRGASAASVAAGIRGCSSGCSCWRSATATGWRWRWTRGRSGRAAVAYRVVRWSWLDLRPGRGAGRARRRAALG